jgi:hypothetical protein
MTLGATHRSEIKILVEYFTLYNNTFAFRMFMFIIFVLSLQQI